MGSEHAAHSRPAFSGVMCCQACPRLGQSRTTTLSRWALHSLQYTCLSLVQNVPHYTVPAPTCSMLSADPASMSTVAFAWLFRPATCCEMSGGAAGAQGGGAGGAGQALSPKGKPCRRL